MLNKLLSSRYLIVSHKKYDWRFHRIWQFSLCVTRRYDEISLLQIHRHMDDFWFLTRIRNICSKYDARSDSSSALLCVAKNYV